MFFGLQAFIPIYFAVELGTSEAAGNGALSVMLVAGAVGTYVGGRLVDRLGRRPIVVLSMGALAPLLVAFLLVGRWPATVLLVAIGFVVIANFSITVVMGQEYLPNRLGLASGITLGAAIGVGGLAAAALGALADHTSLTTTLWVIALIPMPAFLIALTLPPTEIDRELARSVREFTEAESNDDRRAGVSQVRRSELLAAADPDGVGAEAAVGALPEPEAARALTAVEHHGADPALRVERSGRSAAFQSLGAARSMPRCVGRQRARFRGAAGGPAATSVARAARLRRQSRRRRSADERCRAGRRGPPCRFRRPIAMPP